MIEIPSGALPIMPAGIHQVTDVGDMEVLIIFVEPAVEIAPVTPLDGFVSPFDVYAEGHTKLAEDESWITAKIREHPARGATGADRISHRTGKETLPRTFGFLFLLLRFD